MDYFIQLVDSITSVVNSILGFSAQKPNMERVLEILELEYNVKITLNIAIYPGEHIAIGDRSGCEKTTLANLLTGVYEPCGGERQRLSIARLLLQNPDIIIFDESTSSLDGHSENEILKTIRLLSGSKTVITIAHRLSTVLISDRVALMEDGKIAAIESPSNMFTANGKFHALFSQQIKR